jgi:hypothetical protein
MSQQRLNAEQIARLLTISRRHSTDPGCIEAVQHLVCEYQSQIAEHKRGERAVVDQLLMQGVGDWGRHIFAQPNPEIALARFLGTKQKPGKRIKNTERDRSIAAAVVTTMEGGMTLEKAAAEVAEDYGLSTERVIAIYARKSKEVRARRHEI